MDSLLDTMTNVVGILVILLVVTQLGVRSAVSRIQSRLPEVDATQLQKIKKEHNSLRSSLEITRKEWLSQEPVFKQNKNLLATLNKNIDPGVKKKVEDSQLKVQSLTKEIAANEKKESVLKLELEKMKKELERVKKELAESKKQMVPPVNIVRIPDPRPAPLKSKGEWFVCKNGRIEFVDVDGIAAVAARRLAMMKLQLKYGKVGMSSKLVNKNSRTTSTFEYDGKKVVDYFKRNKIIINRQVVSAYKRDYHSTCWMALDLNTKRGENIVGAARPWSKYRKNLSAVKKRGNYAKFLVYPDSFELYLKVREIANTMRVPAGWQVTTVAKIATGIALPKIRLHRKVPPPQPPKPPKPPPPAGAKPVVKKPKNVLD